MRGLYLFFAVLLLAVSGCRKDKLQKVDFFIDMQNAPDIQIEQMKSYYLSSNKLKIKIEAPESDFYFKDRRNPYMEFPKGLSAVFYNEDMKPISTINANFAVYYQKQKLWKISGNVVVVNEAGAKLKTQELYYDEQNEQIFSIKFVEVYDTSGSVLRGKGGFVSNLQFTRYEFKNVDGIIVTYQNLTPNE